MTDSISGFQIDLSEGRNVFVAIDDSHFYVRFRNAEGFETRLKLSKEAGDALRYLLKPAKESPEAVTRWLAYIVEAHKSDEKTMGWQIAKIDTAPELPA